MIGEVRASRMVSLFVLKGFSLYCSVRNTILALADCVAPKMMEIWQRKLSRLSDTEEQEMGCLH